MNVPSPNQPQGEHNDRRGRTQPKRGKIPETTGSPPASGLEVRPRHEIQALGAAQSKNLYHLFGNTRRRHVKKANLKPIRQDRQLQERRQSIQYNLSSQYGIPPHDLEDLLGDQMVIDCLELLEGRKAHASKKRQEAAHKVDRIVMHYHRGQNWLLFVYSLAAERLEVLDSLPGCFVEEECPESVRDLLSKLISTDQQIPSAVDAVNLCQGYHTILSCESSVVGYIPPSPPEAPDSTLNTSKEEDYQAGVCNQAEESRRELLRKSENASRIFRDMEAAGQHRCLHLEDQMSNMASDAAAANSLLDAILSTAKNSRNQTERENLKTWILSMVDHFPQRCRKKCEGRTQEHQADIEQRRAGDEEMQRAQQAVMIAKMMLES
ncbi:MAG: hypothetical protein Q9219_006665 [cf. Caloplaca sp. 3 TL-2023]